MADATEETYDEELADYEDDADAETTETAKTETATNQIGKGYTTVHASSFRDFLLKPELLSAIRDCAFEHPSEVQHECIPQAILGMDVICQAKSGMGKTAVFVLTTLQQIDLTQTGDVLVLCLCHTRELAHQINKEYIRFSKYMPEFKSMTIYGGEPVKTQQDTLKNDTPHAVVGTPGRIKDLIKREILDLGKVKHFVLDECDQMLVKLDMRRDVQEIFKATPRDKQVMFFSATLSPEIRVVCKKFMQDPMEIYVDNESKLTLHGLQQYYIKLTEAEKNRKLNDLLDALEFNQVVIFVKSVRRCTELDKLLQECNFPSICIHSRLDMPDRLKRFNSFKNFDKRIMVATDLFGRGIDIEKVNIVINYDFPPDSDQYLHRVGRAGRFGTRGLAISFTTDDPTDAEVLDKVQSRFEVKVDVLPDSIDTTTYMTDTS